MDLGVNDNKIVRKKVIPIRPLTPTREAIELVVIQRLNDTNELTTPTVTFMGNVTTYIESWQFCLDLGVAWIVASFFMLEWSMYVVGVEKKN